MLASIGEHGLDLNGAIFDRGREVLHGHRPQRWHRKGVTKVASGASGETDFEQRHRADPDESPLDAVGPLLCIGAGPRRTSADSSMSQSVIARRGS